LEVTFFLPERTNWLIVGIRQKLLNRYKNFRSTETSPFFPKKRIGRKFIEKKEKGQGVLKKNRKN
jgi:hypothetical protein